MTLLATLVAFGLFAAGAAVEDDTDDRKLLRCITTCQDQILTYSAVVCVCQDGTRLETVGARP